MAYVLRALFSLIESPDVGYCIVVCIHVPRYKSRFFAFSKWLKTLLNGLFNSSMKRVLKKVLLKYIKIQR